ncbi:MAG: hypothetical protein VYA54_08510 [Bdellovibrionota bacterium]|nr:hypothetical protein [Bdellovibrionota bacterium]
MLKAFFFFSFIFISRLAASDQILTYEKMKTSLVVKEQAANALILLQLDPQTCKLPLDTEKRKKILKKNTQLYENSSRLPSCEVDDVDSQGIEEIEKLQEKRKKLQTEKGIVENLISDIDQGSGKLLEGTVKTESRKSEKEKTAVRKLASEGGEQCVFILSGDENIIQEKNLSSYSGCQNFCEKEILVGKNLKDYYALCEFAGKPVFDEVKGNGKKEDLKRQRLGVCEMMSVGNGFYKYVSTQSPIYKQDPKEGTTEEVVDIFYSGECKTRCEDFKEKVRKDKTTRSEQDYSVECLEKHDNEVAYTYKHELNVTSFHKVSEQPVDRCSAFFMGIDRAQRPYGEVKIAGKEIGSNECLNFCENLFYEKTSSSMEGTSVEMRCRNEEKILLICNEGYGCG